MKNIDRLSKQEIVKAFIPPNCDGCPAYIFCKSNTNRNFWCCTDTRAGWLEQEQEVEEKPKKIEHLIGTCDIAQLVSTTNELIGVVNKAISKLEEISK